MKKESFIWGSVVTLVLCMFLAGGAGHAQSQSAAVDLNTAGVSELDSLPGIGPAIAARIVAYREKNGPFKRPEDLMNVSGIGEKKFLALKDRVSIAAPKPAQPPQPPSNVRGSQSKPAGKKSNE